MDSKDNPISGTSQSNKCERGEWMFKTIALMALSFIIGVSLSDYILVDKTNDYVEAKKNYVKVMNSLHDVIVRNESATLRSNIQSLPPVSG